MEENIKKLMNLIGGKYSKIVKYFNEEKNFIFDEHDIPLIEINENQIQSLLNDLELRKKELEKISIGSIVTYVGPANMKFRGFEKGSKDLLHSKEKVQILYSYPIEFNRRFTMFSNIHVRVLRTNEDCFVPLYMLSKDLENDILGNKIDLTDYYNEYTNKFYHELKDLELKIKNKEVKKHAESILSKWKKEYGNVFAGFIHDYIIFDDVRPVEISVYREYIPLPQKCYHQITIDMFDFNDDYCDYDIEEKDFYNYLLNNVLKPTDGKFNYYPSLNSLKRIEYSDEDIEKTINYRNKHNIPILWDETYCVISNNLSDKVVKIKDN